MEPATTLLSSPDRPRSSLLMLSRWLHVISETLFGALPLPAALVFRWPRDRAAPLPLACHRSDRKDREAQGGVGLDTRYLPDFHGEGCGGQADIRVLPSAYCRSIFRSGPEWHGDD